MDKRIAKLSRNPHTVSLTDRKHSLFIDPESGAIFVDEGEGDGRMNGAVFSPTNGPVFSVQQSKGSVHYLVLDYRGIQFVVGSSEDLDGLRNWADSANSLLVEKGKLGRRGEMAPSSPPEAPDDDSPSAANAGRSAEVETKLVRDKYQKTRSTPAQAVPAEVKEQVDTYLEQARQEVKRIAKLEREAERIDQEVYCFRMRQPNEP